MKRNPNAAKRRQRLRTWTYEQSLEALPYITSLVRTLREYRLQASAAHRQAELWAQRPGRPNRATLIAHAEACREAEHAERQFQETLDELENLDIYCLDPFGGLVLIPFVHDEQLAWYIYDLFDSEPIRFWRYHSDPAETRRPLAETFDGDSANGSQRLV